MWIPLRGKAPVPLIAQSQGVHNKQSLHNLVIQCTRTSKPQTSVHIKQYCLEGKGGRNVTWQGSHWPAWQGSWHWWTPQDSVLSQVASHRNTLEDPHLTVRDVLPHGHLRTVWAAQDGHGPGWQSSVQLCEQDDASSWPSLLPHTWLDKIKNWINHQ